MFTKLKNSFKRKEKIVKPTKYNITDTVQCRASFRIHLSKNGANQVYLTVPAGQKCVITHVHKDNLGDYTYEVSFELSPGILLTKTGLSDNDLI